MTAQKNKNHFNSLGFTLIELIIVVLLIGVLSGVLVSAINSDQLKKRTEDSTKKANLEKIVSAIEVFRYAEGKISDSDGNYRPSDALLLSTYMQGWPNEPSGAVYYYKTVLSNTQYCVYVGLSSNTNRHLKYYSGWTGSNLKIRECADAAGTGTSCSVCNN
jgi:prepilin-type N-terminal cleavage/methylation domain-containing protein